MLVELVVGVQAATGGKTPIVGNRVHKHVHHHTIQKVLHDDVPQFVRPARHRGTLDRRNVDRTIQAAIPDDRAKGTHNGASQICLVTIVAEDDQRVTILGVGLNTDGGQIIMELAIHRKRCLELCENISRVHCF